MIRVGIGGWTYAPWRGTFYPPGLQQARELNYASRQVTTIEINGTFYGSQKPASFRKWADETPDDFVFSVKGPRFTVNRRRLAEAGESIDRFFGSGVLELGPKLGPVLWQLPPTKAFDPEDLGAFLALLPQEIDGRRLRHVLEVRNDSFRTPDLIGLLRQYGVGLVYADSDKYPAIADVTADFIYARLLGAREEEPNGYADAELDLWLSRCRTWESGGSPTDLTHVGATEKAANDRDCFIYFINGAKVRAPTRRRRCSIGSAASACCDSLASADAFADTSPAPATIDPRVSMPIRPAGLFAALFAASLLLFGLAPRSEAAEKDVTIELNRLESLADACRTYFVIKNGSKEAFEDIKLDMFIFSKEEIVLRRYVISTGDLKPGKTVVRLFEIPELECDKIGRFLVNEISSCETKAGPIEQCGDRVATSSRTGNSFEF